MARKMPVVTGLAAAKRFCPADEQAGVPAEEAYRHQQALLLRCCTVPNNACGRAAVPKGPEQTCRKPHPALRRRERVMQRFVSAFLAAQTLFIPAPSRCPAMDVRLHRPEPTGFALAPMTLTSPVSSMSEVSPFRSDTTENLQFGRIAKQIGGIEES